jgi:RNA polymerase sigma-70 factor (ECF subfamily)
MSRDHNLLGEKDLMAHAEFVRRLAGSLVLDESTADDLAQEAYLTALKSPPRHSGSIKAWFSVVVRNLVRQRKRRETRRQWRESTRPGKEGPAAPPELAEKEELLKKVIDKVLHLEQPYREVVILRFYEGLSTKEIAQRQKIPHETVRTRQRRALERLRESMDEEHDGNRNAWTAALTPYLYGASDPLPRFPLIIQQLRWLPVILLVAGVLVLGVWFIRGLENMDDQEISEVPPPVASPVIQDSIAPSPVPEKPGGSVEPAQEENREPRHEISGTVVDTSGNPLIGITIVAEYSGGSKECLTDKLGRFRFQFQSASRVRVSPSFDPLRYSIVAEKDAPWLNTPVLDAKIVLKLNNGGTFLIRVRDPSIGAFVPRIKCMFRGSGFMTAGAEGEVLKTFHPLPEQSTGAWIDVTVIKPETRPPLKRKVFLAPGETVRVDFDLPLRAAISGRVIDADGKSVVGALVYVGTQIKARGDEPFKPFDPDRISGGVLTREDGVFFLSGSGGFITAWRKGYTPVTVPLEESSQIVLPGLGGMQGRLLDGEGNPAAGRLMFLDRSKQVKTGPDGTFSVGELEAGIRCLIFPDTGKSYGVRIEPRKTAEVELRPGLPLVEVMVVSEGTLLERDLVVHLIGMDPVFSGHQTKVRKGTFTLRDVLPGKYCMFSACGLIGWVDILDSSARADVGSADLTISGVPSGGRAYVVPEGSCNFVHVITGRMAQYRKPAATLKIAPIPIGKYDVGVSDVGIVGRINVKGQGTSFSIK